jgi:bifunctional aspartokinase / homoserine dehydrogenase 1
MSSEHAGRKFVRPAAPPLDVTRGHRPSGTRTFRETRRPLRVMKFGGTSVGDAECIRRVVGIVRNHAASHELVVVVSAMSGVTNQLIEAANQYETGDRRVAIGIFEALTRQHEATACALLTDEALRKSILSRNAQLLREAQSLCEKAGAIGLLDAQTRDFLAGLGERLCAPILAAALASTGMASEAVEATDLIVTDAHYGAADPQMELTRERTETRLRPLLQHNIIPIVTGFIAATPAGVLTTLGRGGSDYSATILAAGLHADDVVIWTDVDGILTADPKLVMDATTIPEISYREAAELAYFGAKVLHPKTLRPVMQSGIPVWIRNTFSPENAGTKITPEGPAEGSVKALTVVREAALITLPSPAVHGAPDGVTRALTTIASLRIDAFLVSKCPLTERIFLVVGAASAEKTAHALRHEFFPEFHAQIGERIHVDSGVAILTVVGQNLSHVRQVVSRAVGELNRKKINIVATPPGSSDCNVSFVIAAKDVHDALATTHREFQTETSSLLQDSRTEAQL